MTPRSSGGVAVFRNVNIVAEDGYITHVGEFNLDKSDFLVECNGVAMPGLFNAHTHLPMVIFRGLVDGLELRDWLGAIWPMEKALSEDALVKGYELGLIESVINGVTAIINMYFMPGSIQERVIDIVEGLGVRVFDGPTFIDSIEKPTLTENSLRNFISLTHGKRFVRPIVNLHSVYANSDDTLSRVAELKRSLNIPLNTHVSETRWEVYEVRRRFGAYPVEVLDRFGMLDDKAILVHLGWVTNWELELIRAKGPSLVHCPTSNMKLATAGFFPIRDVLSQVNVALGTDGAGSNDSLDMFREMKMAILLQRNNYWDASALGAEEAFTMATLNGYRAVGLRGGVVEPGYLADIVVLDINDPRIWPLNEYNITRNIVYSATGSMVRHVIVGGRPIYSRGVDNGLVERGLRLAGELNSYIVDKLLGNLGRGG